MWVSSLARIIFKQPAFAVGGELARRPQLSHCAELSPTLLHVCLKRECEMWPWLFTLNLEAQTCFLSFVTQWPLLSAAWGCEFFLLVNLAASVILTENVEKPWAGQQVQASREHGGFTFNIVGKGFILFSSLRSMQSVNYLDLSVKEETCNDFPPLPSPESRENRRMAESNLRCQWGTGAATKSFSLQAC